MIRAIPAVLFLAAILLGDARADRPNVVVLLIDDQGYGDMSCHGNPYIETPNIDRLHDEGVRLTDFHVDPTCSPTRAALLTGRYSSRVGVWLTYGGRHHLRADETTMADVFAESGYRTAVFGKWHLGENYPFRPNDRGFDESLVHGGGAVGEAPDYWGNDYYDDVYVRNGEPERVEGYCTDVWFREAMRFIGRQDEAPFFIYLPTNAPHGPCNVPWEYAAPFADHPEIGRFEARFLGMLANIDENIGRLLRCLDERQLADDTIVVFMTDNGGTGGKKLFNAGLRAGKASAYDGGHRAACFLRWPNGRLVGGRDVDQRTAHIDILPTLRELCELSPPDVAFDGRSLVPLLRGDATDWPARTLFVHHQGRFGRKLTDDRPIKYKDSAVMTDRWRLVGNELYDIRRDPGQRNDVARDNADVVTRLSGAYEQWWADISTRFDEYNSTVIDPAKQVRVKLTCQEWHGETVLYNQQHVRAGVVANGFWDLDVAAPGEYDVTLRRWPEELDLPIDATVPPPTLDPARHDTAFKLNALPSGAIDAKTARLRIGDFDQTRAVREGDKCVTFRVPLPEGPTRMQTWLTDAAGQSRGAYYVAIEPVAAE